MFGLFGRDVAIDLGTANTLAFVALDNKTDGVVAVGCAARRMLGRVPENVVDMRPLKDGVMAGFGVMEKVLSYSIRKVRSQRRLSRSPGGPRVVACVPSGVTGADLRAVKEATESAEIRGRDLVTGLSLEKEMQSYRSALSTA